MHLKQFFNKIFLDQSLIEEARQWSSIWVPPIITFMELISKYQICIAFWIGIFNPKLYSKKL